MLIEQMSVADLEAVLAAKKKQEKEEAQQKREAYEQNRDQLITSLGEQALETYHTMQALKDSATAELLAFRDKMLEYGDLRRGELNRGNFEVKNGQFKVVFSSQVVKRFDERAQLAEKKISQFLTSFVKKKDRQLYKIISELLKRNEETDQFDVDLINRLYKMEDDFEDPNWKEGLRLFKESYAPAQTNQYIRFFRALPSGGWEPILLDFAKIKTAAYEQQEQPEA